MARRTGIDGGGTPLVTLFVLTALGVLARGSECFALGREPYVQIVGGEGSFGIVQAGRTATVYVDGADHAGVIRAANDLAADVNRVAAVTPTIVRSASDLRTDAILIGTIGKSPVIDDLVARGKIDVSDVAGRWESSLTQVVIDPMPGVGSALVIAGSDKRGTIYGIYDLSEQIGVSPWYWWADVPVRKREALFVKPGRYVRAEPAVKYRGIFLNDEAPALSGWTHEKFGGFNSKFYTKVFELLLRLRANYLWPAMWGNAFNEDDPANPKLADEYGIVMGTSHHEPMLRAQQEWKRHGKGPWDYAKNAQVLRSFWAEGIRRNKDFESIVTLAMRGDGDEPMSESANIALLERIVADQREVIADEVNPDPTRVPQLWALYKEVQEYYERGMRVPDDVTLLWCDDNWGNIRRLPTEDERKRPGGAGIYYHFDYVGGPRSYKWLNTYPIAKVWEQMNLAYHYGANRIWIVNVGDLKPMEFPIEFFLQMAWDPRRWPKEKLAEYTRAWVEREFGPEHAADIADVIAKYTKYNGRRKPELMEPTTYSLIHYHEADTVLAEWRAIVERAESIHRSLPEAYRDAFFQLVLHPAKASAIVTELHITAGRNRLYASQGRASANALADRTRELFRADAELTGHYNRVLAGGKWNHLMDQTHLGYVAWYQPPKNVMPEVAEVQVFDPAELGVAIEGSSPGWPGAWGDPVLPAFDAFNRQKRFIDVFNRGRAEFKFTATGSAPWIVLSESEGTIDADRRLWVSIDWDNAPTSAAKGNVKIARVGGDSVTVNLSAFNPAEPARDALRGFVEADGFVSIEAEHFTAKRNAGEIRWERIPDHGRTLSSMMIVPATAKSVTPPRDAPCLEYQMYLFTAGKVEVETIIAPTLNFVPSRGLRFAVSFDDQPPRVIDALGKNAMKDWEDSVRDGVRKVRSTHTLASPGKHTLKFWMVDPGVVLQKLVVNLGGVKPSYLGPPESFRK